MGAPKGRKKYPTWGKYARFQLHKKDTKNIKLPARVPERQNEFDKLGGPPAGPVVTITINAGLAARLRE